MPHQPSRRAVLRLAGAVLALSGAPVLAAAPPRVQVFKNPSCGCCTGWVDHLRTEGFAVDVVEVPDTAPVRRQAGIPEALGSCHTARVDGYALEGHVPAREIRRLLKERPEAVGLAVPGMPAGSPGMEVPGGRKDAYEVLLVDRAGRARTYARYA